MTVVVVSWILVLLAVFGVNYSHEVISESRTIQREVDRSQIRAWAQSGVELAAVTLENTAAIDCAILGLAGPENPFAFSLPCGQGRFAVGESQVAAGRRFWAPGIGDEGSRLPMVLADSTALAVLPGMTDAGMQIILQAKRDAGENRVPPFELLTELDEPSRECAGRYLSRYGDAVNVNTASAEVLEAVGLPTRVVDKLMDWRAGPDRVPGTPDDQLFEMLGAGSRGIRACALSNDEAAVLAFLFGASRLTVESRYFRLVSRGWGDGYQGVCEIRVVLKKKEFGKPSVLEWSETWLN